MLCALLPRINASRSKTHHVPLGLLIQKKQRSSGAAACVSDTASGTFLGTVLTPVPIPMDNGQRELAPDDLMLDAEAGSWTPQEFEEKYLSPNGENGGR